jgi:hypothetical protein
MARTFSYQKQHRNQQAPPLRAAWHIPKPERSERDPFAALADKVSGHRQRITMTVHDKVMSGKRRHSDNQRN